MPNLLFKRRNVKGSTTEELDQIYLIKMEEKKKIIEGFDYFYYYESNNDKEDNNNDNIKIKGKPLELEDDNLYFMEIKKSLEGLRKSYKTIEKDKEATNTIISMNTDNTNMANTIIINTINTTNEADSINIKPMNAINMILKEDNLTDIGNVILTSNIFAKLINSIILKKKK